MKRSHNGITLAVFIVSSLVVLSFPCRADEAEDWYDQGLSNYKQGLYGRALECFTKAIELNPNRPIAYANRGNIYFILAQYGRSVNDYSTYIKLKRERRKPIDSRIYISRGQAYDLLDDFSSAYSDYTTFINLEPENPEGYYLRGLLYYNNREEFGLDEARVDITKACELGLSKACRVLTDLMR